MSAALTEYRWRVGPIEYRVRRLHPELLSCHPCELRISEKGQPPGEWYGPYDGAQLLEELLRLAGGGAPFPQERDGLFGPVSRLSAGLEAERRESDFEVWWAAYPKKVGKKDARKAWMSAKGIPLLATLLACLEAQKATRRWLDGFVPDPATWIRGERWNDDPAAMGRGKVDEAPEGLPESIRRRWPTMDRDERAMTLENLAVGGFR